MQLKKVLIAITNLNTITNILIISGILFSGYYFISQKYKRSNEKDYHFYRIIDEVIRINESSLRKEIADNGLFQTIDNDTITYDNLNDGIYLLIGNNTCNTCLNSTINYLEKVLSLNSLNPIGIISDFENFKSLILWDRDNSFEAYRILENPPGFTDIESPLIMRKSNSANLLLPIYEIQKMKLDIKSFQRILTIN